MVVPDIVNISCYQRRPPDKINGLYAKEFLVMRKNMDKHKKVLVVGAGPSGMVFALSLAKAGVPVRIIDRRSKRAGISNATGISLGTMKALLELGISEDITQSMTPMSKFIFYEDNKLISDLCIPLLNNEPPAYLYPQIKLERIIESKLNDEGVFVEYQSSIEGINNEGNSIAEIRIKLPGGATEKSHFKWIVGADGAHSTVRELCKFKFNGRIYPEKWSVAEIEVDDWDTEIQAKLFLGSNGVGLFLSNPESAVIQGILNGPNVGELLREKYPTAKFNYERKFKVSLKRVTSPRKNRVWVIGDAAHVQSPVGGQGLNLAVADAVILAELLECDPLNAEKKLARQARKTLLFTDCNYRMLATTFWGVRMLRSSYWALASKSPVISRWFFKSISGLNHYKKL
ncbi:MAG: FAD-dependent monooxygenase [Candidatus Electrothrix sp. ATG1]|nr:FAD-dependent monooxygenase [Candidatus Electrothrix sp. ATG1]